MKNIQSHIISALVTIGSVFLASAASILMAIPDEAWNSPEVYTTAFWFAIIVAIFRGMIRPLVAMFVRNYYK